MADRPPNPDANTSVKPNENLPPSTPRWVKVFGAIAIVLVLLVVGLMIFGGGEHGPARHLPSGDPGALTPPIEQGRVGGPADAAEAASTVEAPPSTR